MIRLTAIIRSKSGHEATVGEELLNVLRHARAQEPGTIGYEVIQGDDPMVFITWESYQDRAALSQHNEGPAVSRFLKTTAGMVQNIEIITGEVVSEFD